MASYGKLWVAARRGRFATLSDRQAALLLAALCFAVALVARLLWPFDGLYGQDAYAYFRYAAALWPSLCCYQPLPIYYWPAGYPLLVALVLPLVGWSSAAGQIVSVLSGAATAAFTFFLCRELLPNAPGGRASALIAGLTVALSGALLRANLVVMSDAAAVAWCAVAMWATVRYTRTQRAGWLVAAALALAWATITRWVVGLLVLPLALCWLLETKERVGKTKLNTIGLRPSSFFLPPSSLLHLALALPIGALIVIVQILVSQKTPVALSQHQWLVSWSLAYAWQRNFTTVDGAQQYATPVAIYNLWHMARLGCLAPFGVAWLVLHRRWAALLLLGGWPLMLFLFLCGVPLENARFVLPALPALAVLTGIGFGWMSTALTGSWRTMLIGVYALVLIVSIVLGARDYQRLVESKNDDLALAAWVSEQLPDNATLLTFGATLTMQHYTHYDVRELFYLDSSDLNSIVRQSKPVYLLFDIGSIERQWTGLRPEQNVRFLEHHHDLDIVGKHGVYTLFRLRESR